MGVKVTGMEKTLGDIKNRLGKGAIQLISDKALRAGAEVFVKVLIREFQSVKDKRYAKGYTVEEITISEPMWVDGVRTIKVHWRGPHDRFRLIHLNEWGTIQNPNPPRKGVIARALKNAENAYRNAIKQAIERGL